MRPNVFFLIAALVTAVSLGAAQAQTAEQKRAFNSADANGDGSLNQAEYTKFVQQLADQGDRQAKVVRTFGAYGRAFRYVDANKDRRLTVRELLGATAKVDAKIKDGS